MRPRRKGHEALQQPKHGLNHTERRPPCCLVNQTTPLRQTARAPMGPQSVLTVKLGAALVEDLCCILLAIAGVCHSHPHVCDLRQQDV
jgi:hypothetical protein